MQKRSLISVLLKRKSVEIGGASESGDASYIMRQNIESLVHVNPLVSPGMARGLNASKEDGGRNGS